MSKIMRYRYFRFAETELPQEMGLPSMILNCIWLRFSSSGDLASVEYPLIAVTPRSTQIRSGGCTT